MERTRITDNPDGIRRAAAERFSVYNKTAAYTLTEDDHGKTFTATAAGGSITFTLPAPKAGLAYRFQKANATTDIILATPAGSAINYGTAGQVFKNITDADGVGYAACVAIVCDGTDWFVVSGNGTWVNAAS